MTIYHLIGLRVSSSSSVNSELRQNRTYLVQVHISIQSVSVRTGGGFSTSEVRVGKGLRPVSSCLSRPGCNRINTCYPSVFSNPDRSCYNSYERIYYFEF